MNRKGVKNIDALLLTIAVIWICVGIVILGVYAYILLQWSLPQIISEIGQTMLALPLLAMTTGKHDFPPIKKSDIIIAIIVAVLAIICGLILPS